MYGSSFVRCSSCHRQWITYRSIAKKHVQNFSCSDCSGVKRYVECACTKCAKPFLIYPSHIKMGLGKTCSKRCFGLKRRGMIVSPETRAKLSLAHIGKHLGESHPQWKGGRYITNSSRFKHKPHLYIRVNCYVRQHKRTITIRRYEHRLVMERIIGRPLKKDEVVHHINHNTLDNQPSNLMLFKTNAEHKRWHGLHKIS